jgi:hypothetical protein
MEKTTTHAQENGIKRKKKDRIKRNRPSLEIFKRKS